MLTNGARLMDVARLQEESSVSKHTWRTWIRQGRLPVVRLGRRVFVVRDDYEMFIRANRVEAREVAAR